MGSNGDFGFNNPNPGLWRHTSHSAYENGFAKHPCYGAPPTPLSNTQDNSDGALDLCRKNLIVNYLPQHYSDEDLYDLFIPFGPLHSVRVMRDDKTGYSYGFGFINYLVDEHAKFAREMMNGANVDIKRLKVSYARPSCDEIKDSNCYVRNLPITITDETFVEMFGKFGIIVQKKILRDSRTGIPRGSAFVRYANRDQAAACISFMNHYIPPGSTCEMRVKLAQDHGRQKAAYIAGFQDAIHHHMKRHPLVNISDAPVDIIGSMYGHGTSHPTFSSTITSALRQDPFESFAVPDLGSSVGRKSHPPAPRQNPSGTLTSPDPGTSAGRKFCPPALRPNPSGTLTAPDPGNSTGRKLHPPAPSEDPSVTSGTSAGRQLRPPTPRPSGTFTTQNPGTSAGRPSHPPASRQDPSGTFTAPDPGASAERQSQPPAPRQDSSGTSAAPDPGTSAGPQ